ncbi:MAG: hypothetical protein AABZ55_13785 [Bdellovibrionota bacterium]
MDSLLLESLSDSENNSEFFAYWEIVKPISDRICWEIRAKNRKNQSELEIAPSLRRKVIELDVVTKQIRRAS